MNNGNYLRLSWMNRKYVFIFNIYLNVKFNECQKNSQSEKSFTILNDFIFVLELNNIGLFSVLHLAFVTLPIPYNPTVTSISLFVNIATIDWHFGFDLDFSNYILNRKTLSTSNIISFTRDYANRLEWFLVKDIWLHLLL